MRLIDADVLRDKLHKLASYDWNQICRTFWANVYNECADMVDEQPTIELQKWIPCSEMLPEIGVHVLLSSGNGMFTAEGCLKSDGDWYQFSWSTIWPSDYVDAWMPLPEPYEGKDQ